jgi:hypothetical protein
MNKHFLTGITFLTLMMRCLFANEVLINTIDGEMMILEINPSETMGEIQNKIAMLTHGRHSQATFALNQENETLKEYCLQTVRHQGQYLGYPRNYFAEVDPSEKNDIRLIFNHLANKNWIGLAFVKEELESAGDRIDHLHPLRFLMTVFADEELKVLVRNVRAKGWIWNHFISGLKECLATESSIGNMKAEYILHFAESLKISPSLIAGAIASEMWDEFVDLLITHIPRKGDFDHFDS